MAKKCSGLVLIRQLLGNCSRSSSPSCGGLVQQKIVPCTLTRIPNTQTIRIPSDSEPFSSSSRYAWDHYLGQYRRCPYMYHRIPSDEEGVYSSGEEGVYSSGEEISIDDTDYRYLNNQGPSNLVRVSDAEEYYDKLKKVEDELLPAVFYFTATDCRASRKWIRPVLYKLCDQYPHITIYKVHMAQNGIEPSLLGLKVYSSPTFRFYLNGEMVDEVKSASGIRLTKSLANIYSSSGVRKRRATSRAKKEDEGVELSEQGDGAVEVAECRLPATSICKVMAAIESLPDAQARPDGTLWWFAKGLFLSQEKREEFSKVEDPDLKLEWLKRETGVSPNTEVYFGIGSTIHMLYTSESCQTIDMKAWTQMVRAV